MSLNTNNDVLLLEIGARPSGATSGGRMLNVLTAMEGLAHKITSAGDAASKFLGALDRDGFMSTRDYYRRKHFSRSKYNPHQGKRECARRVWQRDGYGGMTEAQFRALAGSK